MNALAKSIRIASCICTFHYSNSQGAESDIQNTQQTVEDHTLAPLGFKPTYKATAVILTDVDYANGTLSITFAGRWDKETSPEKQNEYLLETFCLSGAGEIYRERVAAIARGARELRGRRATISLKPSAWSFIGGIMFLDIDTTQVDIAAGPLPQ